MNFVEVMELLRAVSAFHVKAPEERPKFHVYDNQNEGYVICTKASSVNKECLSFLKDIAEKRELGIREFEGFLIIHTR